MKKISLLLLLTVPLFCLAQEKVFYNAKIFTADSQQPFAEAIAINGKIITAVGNYNDLKKKASSEALWIDLIGGFLMPGFVDSHNHGIYGGRELTKANFNPYIHPSLYQWQYPARSLLQAGATICGASDWPVTTANPFEAMYHAETRKGPMGVLDSTQCMPRMAMLYAYTSEAAKALMLEKTIGTLQAGKFANMILLDRDVFTVAPEVMMNTRVLWTMFEGKKVYEAVNIR